MTGTKSDIKEVDENSFEQSMSRNEKLLNKRVTSEHQFTDLDTGWAWIVLAGSFGTFCLMGGTQFASGVVNMILLDRYQASVSLTSVAGAVHMSIISSGAPLSSFLLERYSCRVAIVSSGCLFFLGYFGTAFAPNIECVIFTYGIVAGVGGALGYTASMVVVGFNFRRRRNIAMGIAVAGAGFGISFLAPLMQYINKAYGPFGFFVLLSGVFAQNIVFGTLSYPSKLECYTKSTHCEQGLEGRGGRDIICGKLRGYWHVSSNKSILFLSLGLFAFGLGTYLVYLHLPRYIVKKGFPQTVAANLISLSGVLTAAGRILTGSVSSIKFIRDDILYCLPMFILGIMTIIYPHISNTFAGNLVFTIFLGLFSGNVYVLTASVSVKCVGILNLAKAIGVQYFFCGVGILVGPIMAGIVVDSGGTYDDSFYTAGAFLLIAGCFSAIASFVSESKPLKLEDNSKGIEEHEAMVNISAPRTQPTTEHKELVKKHPATNT